MSETTTDLGTPQGAYDHLGEIQLVDCRELYEWAAGRIEGAVHIPLNSIMAGVTGELDPEKPVVVEVTADNAVPGAALAARGFNIVIHANHLLRAAHLAMQRTAQTILLNDRSLEASSECTEVKRLFEAVGYEHLKQKDLATLPANFGAKLLS